MGKLGISLEGGGLGRTLVEELIDKKTLVKVEARTPMQVLLLLPHITVMRCEGEKEGFFNFFYW